jgi:Reverse transcriptase (RNA-dependent DNA polymerase)
VVNRICSRAQKCYNTKRYAQEVLINVWEQIQFCKQHNIKAAVVAIDMAKAFDTLSHDYLDKVYKFFNLGPNMQRWLKLLGNNREACISLEGGNNSRYFKLESGRPQGDNVSPNTFNFGAQILIFKVELDVSIQKIPRIVNNIIPQVPLFEEESNRETDKNESLADDNTTIMLLEEQGLTSLKTNLNDFAGLSGLHCNFNKTCIMPTGELSEDESRYITELGFRITYKFTLLGVEIVHSLNNVDEILTKIRDKIINLISFWDRFKLSLPRRITVAKTFLISQLSYVACFLSPGEQLLTDIQNIIDNFVKGGLNISSQRMYTGT